MTIIFLFPLTFPKKIFMGIQKYLKKLGAQIRKLREEQHLSQSDLARMVDRDRQMIHKLENGDLNATVATLKLIAEALQIPVGSLFEFEDEQ